MSKGPEAIIQEKIIMKLRYLQWSVRATHGNLYQNGFPDLFAAHRSFGQRWIEVKDPNRKGNVFTEAQHQYFRELDAVGCGVWVLTGDSDDEIAKLRGPANWWHYLQVVR